MRGKKGISIHANSKNEKNLPETFLRKVGCGPSQSRKETINKELALSANEETGGRSEVFILRMPTALQLARMVLANSSSITKQ